jgi:hypothetical protein
MAVMMGMRATMAEGVTATVTGAAATPCEAAMQVESPPRPQAASLAEPLSREGADPT